MGEPAGPSLELLQEAPQRNALWLGQLAEIEEGLEVALWSESLRLRAVTFAPTGDPGLFWRSFQRAIQQPLDGGEGYRPARVVVPHGHVVDLESVGIQIRPGSPPPPELDKTRELLAEKPGYSQAGPFFRATRALLEQRLWEGGGVRQVGAVPVVFNHLSPGARIGDLELTFGRAWGWVRQALREGWSFLDSDHMPWLGEGDRFATPQEVVEVTQLLEQLLGLS